MTPWADYKEEAYSFWAASSTPTLRDKTRTKEGRGKSKDRRWKSIGAGQQFPFPKSKNDFYNKPRQVTAFAMSLCDQAVGRDTV